MKKINQFYNKIYNKQIDGTGLAIFRICYSTILFCEILQMFYFRHLIFDEIHYLNLPEISSAIPIIIWAISVAFILFGLFTKTALIEYLKENNIWAVFHYLSLHVSEFYKKECQGSALPNANKYTDCLIRLPFFYELKNEQIDYITRKIFDFYGIDFIF